MAKCCITARRSKSREKIISTHRRTNRTIKARSACKGVARNVVRATTKYARKNYAETDCFRGLQQWVRPRLDLELEF